jgi:hypothetical protein
MQALLGPVCHQDDTVYTSWCLTMDVSGLQPPCALRLDVRTDAGVLDSQPLLLLDASMAGMVRNWQK